MSGKWKVDENGALVLKDGNPVLITDNGESVVASDTVVQLRAEAKAHRVAKEEALTALKVFEGLDPVVARKSIETVTKLDAKQLIDAGEVDAVRQQISQQFQSQLSEKESAIKGLESRYNNTLINNVFSNSEFVRNSVAVPRDMFEATFRSNLKIENGEVQVFGKDGNRLFSKERAGEYATPEEGLRLLAEMHPSKDSIIKAQVASGTGNTGGGGVGSASVIKRSEFEALPPLKQRDIATKVAKGEMSLTD